MEKIGVLLVSYGSRAASIADALCRSENYAVEIFDADKQKNPFILERSKEYMLGLDIEKIAEFAKKHKDEIDFGIVGPEGPIVDGVRDVVEREAGIPVICPTKEYAIEGSKVKQRELMDKCCPEANPRFKVFDPAKDGSLSDVKKEVWKWLDEFDNEVAVKPDEPATGKGVGVWGEHFQTKDELFEHFATIYEHGQVLIEEKIEGEEFSLQFFSDGKHLIETPCVRDYKLAFDGDRGPNTGGMGCYKDAGNKLPFMSRSDWEEGLKIGKKVFEEMKGEGSNPGLRGIPLYMAYTCAKSGVKFFEINSRPGDPEIMNLMPILKGDFVDICFDMIDEKLKKMEFEKQATVITYAVPMTYGGYRSKYSGSKKVDLTDVYKLRDEYNSKLRVYPGSMELGDDGNTYALGSRAVGCVGIADNIEGARSISLEGITALDGPLWNRWDIGSKEHIERSIEHVRNLRK
jgi:phosphoribosylamine--glycine ligase